MSSTTWTPRAVASEVFDCELPLWRTVEAQHVVATRALVDTLAEQELLESLLDEAKPRVPEPCAGLDYLLYTPFRYPPTHAGSRFRAYTDAGVWYGAEHIHTCCAEIGYWRWRFISDSEGLERLDAVPHTIFQAHVQGRAVDLRVKPFVRHRSAWTDANDYGACQGLAGTARAAGVQLIRYESVRDPEHGGCAAVLDCQAFLGTGGIRKRQSWFLTVDRERASWVRAGAARGERYEFTLV